MVNAVLGKHVVACLPRAAARVTAAFTVFATLTFAQTATRAFDASMVQQLMSQFHVPGVSIAVISDFKIDWAKGYGTMDVQTVTPVTVDTMFQAASISKTVAAMTSNEGDSRRTLRSRSGR